MTEEEVAQKILDGMVEMFGDTLANPEHQPLLYKYQEKLFFYELGLKKKQEQE